MASQTPGGTVADVVVQGWHEHGHRRVLDDHLQRRGQVALHGVHPRLSLLDSTAPLYV
jgi:hypothetical protein